MIHKLFKISFKLDMEITLLFNLLVVLQSKNNLKLSYRANEKTYYQYLHILLFLYI